jgi:hypothetical protein
MAYAVKTASVWCPLLNENVVLKAVYLGVYALMVMSIEALLTRFAQDVCTSLKRRVTG